MCEAAVEMIVFLAAPVSEALVFFFHIFATFWKVLFYDIKERAQKKKPNPNQCFETD